MVYLLRERQLKNSSAVLRAYGPDANSYLQGQFTQELRIKAGASAYGLWLDLKGKVIADSTVLKLKENEFLIFTTSAGAEAMRTRLEANVISDDVAFIDETARWEGLLFWGEDAAALGAPVAGVAFPSRRPGSGGIQWFVPQGQGDEVLEPIKAMVEETPEAMERARIASATPAVPSDIGPRDLPNEGGLEEVAISFTKGCYLGQEVMARLKNLGQVRRRLHVVRGRGAPPLAQTPLHQSQRKVGETRSSVADGDEFLAMAMLSLVNLDAQAGLSLAPNGAADITIVRRV